MQTHISTGHGPWNKGKLIGQKAPLKAKEVWAIRAHLEMAHRTRDLALFNLGFNSKLRYGADVQFAGFELPQPV